MIKNTYIHIPFCSSKCNYCVFNSVVNSKLIPAFLKALKTQIATQYMGEKLNTLYLGGGTPSLLSKKDLINILSMFNFENDAEITVECNPESYKLYDFVNRISLGCQTFDDRILQLIGRKHTAQHVKEAVKFYQNNGIENISLDFIYGLPTQNNASFLNDLKCAINLGIKHISLYGLKIEKGSYFYKFMPKNLPSLDEQADMYLLANDILTKNGFNHYEISNWALPGFSSRHNLNYWDNNTYYGFGCGASGYDGNLRYTNTNILAKYIKNPLLRDYEEKIDKTDKLIEEIILGFRKSDGINTKVIYEKFNIDFDNVYEDILTKYRNYFVKTEHGWALSLDGMLISNEILSEFV